MSFYFIFFVKTLSALNKKIVIFLTSQSRFILQICFVFI